MKNSIFNDVTFAFWRKTLKVPPDVRNGIVQAWDTVGERSHATLPPLTSVFSTKRPSGDVPESRHCVGELDVLPLWQLGGVDFCHQM